MLQISHCTQVENCSCRGDWEILTVDNAVAVVECFACCLLHVVPRRLATEHSESDSLATGSQIQQTMR